MSLAKKRVRQKWGVWLPLLGVFICAALAIGLAIIGTLLSEPESTKDDEGARTIVYGLTLLPSGFDPHIHRSAELGIPLYNVYDTLVYRHPQTKDFIPGLADSWEIGDDGLTYTFQLRSDVTFHDGTPFDASAVGVTLDRILDPNTRSQKALPLLGPFVGYTIIDPYTIQLRLSEPFAPLLDALSQPYLGIASPTALANYTDGTYQFHQVGTGPFEMADFVPGDRIVLRRNPDYAWGPPYYSAYTDESVERVIFRFYEAPETRRVGLVAGDVDLVGELPPTDADLLLRNPDFKLHLEPIPGQPLQFYFNTARFPTDDFRIRQAILYATNRQAIVGTVFFDQFSTTAYGPLAETTLYYDPAVKDLYTYSADQARSLLASAEVTDSDDNGVLDKAGEPIKLRVVFMGFGFLPEVTQLLQSQWREFGLEVELVQVASYTSLREYAESGDFNLIAFNDFSLDPSLLNRYFLSDGDSNWTGYSDPELDGWLLDATRTIDPATRQQLYTNVQRRIMDQALVLPIRDYTNLVGLAANLDGLIYTAQGWWPLLTNLTLP